MHKLLCLALLLAASAAHALSDSEKEMLMTTAVEAYEQQDYATALEKWQTLAEAGNAEAQNNLGILYNQGQGVAQNYAQARAWFEKAAAQGHANAQNSLGFLYAEGQGIAQDYGQARAWYEKAAAQGYAKAQYNLGNFYSDGRGVPQDFAKAREWYEKAAAQEDNEFAQQAAQKALQDLNKTSGKKP